MLVFVLIVCFFFFKQKTAYEMRISAGVQTCALPISGLSLLPFFLLSALSGQLADTIDKAKIIRLVKTAEILIMLGGSAGLLIAAAGHTRIGMGLMLAAVLCLGVHSTFFGTIKYAILPQHLDRDHVLGGTGLIEAGTYLAILLGTVRSEEHT